MRPLAFLLLIGLLTPASSAADCPYLYDTEWGSEGSGPGEFSRAGDVATDASGNVYVADVFNSRIQKFSGSGTFLLEWSTVATGPGPDAYAYGICASPSGYVYVAVRDMFTPASGKERVLKFDLNGSTGIGWGIPGSDPGEFGCPTDVAVNAAGDVFVSDPCRSKILKFDESGAFVSEWDASSIGYLACDPDGNVWGPSSSPTNSLRKYAPDGSFLGSIGTTGSGPGEFLNIGSLAITDDWRVFVGDSGRIQELDATGLQACQWGEGVGSGPSEFDGGPAVAADGDGNVFAADGYNYRVQKFVPDGTQALTSTWGRLKSIYR